MNLTFRKGHIEDLASLKDLAIKSWSQFQHMLSAENWDRLYDSLNDLSTYTELLGQSTCIICTAGDNQLAGMAFLVPSGNPTEIYDAQWSYIRFLSVDPSLGGRGIGRQLTEKCIHLARSNKENMVALHTSELMDNARHIYESMGFTILKEIDQRLGKRYWLYTLDLTK